MALLKPAENTTAKLKMGLMGFQGSGKTYTMTSVAIGLVQLMRELGLPEGNKPIAFMDTETGSDWVRPRIESAGIKLITAKTRALSDLLTVIEEAESQASILLVDLVTHVWREFVASYLQAKNRSSLRFDDWNFLKGERGWQQFTDRFVNSDLHFLFAGRAGFEYDFNTDEETGKKQLEKTGIKMKAEGETGYEPNLLVLMERQMNMETKADQHVAHVIKDRSTLLDGKEIPDPTFESFLPHIRCLNLGGRQLGVDTTRNSKASIPADAPRDKSSIQRAVVIDEINDLLMRHDAAGTSKDAQRKRSELIQKHFGTVSKTAIEELMPLFELRAGYDSLHRHLQGAPSRYAPPLAAIPGDFDVIKARKPVEINDEIPDFEPQVPLTGEQLRKDLTVLDAG